ncbi:hypothetical protein GDO81_006216 [Engystomops pustulosus]|uniref:G-protein coupled receptors family 1 profile domain-containing protein n=1 Tax=Engystomops pustulosus TaxID=76066 RepID=A0AAV7CV71_ENGPU|nr:hypothetical protein GDO81_011880 [Engystomops pustulosus]KAG8589024.1 hypothetical protein GDO81_006216 [Engystomops pustulosus]
MCTKNQTLVTELFLIGFSRDSNTNIVLFFIFFLVYVSTFVGNCIIICVIIYSPQLHVPMYFFLCILSFLDLSYSSTVTPKLLSDLLSNDPTISVGGCAIQLYLTLLLGGTECLLLALMAYDRYLAICRPLHYPVLMRWRTCYWLTRIVGLFGFTIFILPSFFMPVPLCNPNQINHFMSSVLKIHSTGRSRAFSTCTSHISVVVLFFGTGMTIYFGSSSLHSSNQMKYISVFYVILTPMLNPIIYSLNNRDVKVTMRKVVVKITTLNSQRTLHL